MAEMEVKVPDIGDFRDVPVIELLVKNGERIAKDAPLVTLESEKATFEVPSPAAGIVKALKVKVGDKVSQGSAIIVLDGEDLPAKQTTAVKDDKQPQDSAPPVAEPKKVELRVPDIGDFKDVPVIEILVKRGDTVKVDDPLVTLESEKATFEVPASAAGVVEEIALKNGDKVSQGTLIATITSGAALPPPSSRPQIEPGKVIATPANSNPSPEVRLGSDNATVHASPSIRRFARELGVDLQRVKGSGPNERVTREDVQHFVKGALQSGGAPSGAAASGAGVALGIAPWPKIDFAQYGPIEAKPLTRIQKLSGPNLHRNWVMIPHVTNNDDADVTDIEAFRKELNAEHGPSGVKVTMLAFLIKAIVAALREFPQFNSSLDGEGLILKKYYNIGFAADTPNGLIVPVIKGADKKGVIDIAREAAELSAKGRDGKLGPADMSGGTFTISSLGGIGGTYFTPIINAPEVAILGVCKAAMRPVWNGESFEPRLILPLSLSYDHRVIDGAAAARFNVHLAALLADMRRTLL
ncbi:MAG: dihydrolipoyllysine-residue acetyltransferase [Vulcanimicrobiaceae bacterium]